VLVGPAPRLDAAIQLAETAEIDAAILDIDLDGTPVWPAAEALVARGIPFVLASGYGASLVVPPSLLDRPVLNKPFTLMELRTTLVGLLTGPPRETAHQT
jgi:DNA-binding response OmpR family regulator